MRPAPASPLPGISAGDARHARAGLDLALRAQARVDELVAAMDEAGSHGASLLPGWSRRHVITHLARNADGLVNLLSWARTGIEHPMYASAADRDADIEEGSRRLFQIQQEDSAAASGRFFTAANDLPTSAWTATVSARNGVAMPATLIPWLRVNELLVHAVDLDYGITFQDLVDLAGEHLETVLAFIAIRFAGRADVPSVTLEIVLPDGSARVMPLGMATATAPRVIGLAAPAIAWLTGRSDGADLTGDVPVLPAWG
ncbi:MAG TPA: maleylpyruvate isomerase family mycothiol-dependent enzyme [Pseudonocardiaceae bacterium]|nr:maleylpyruvate isomerase family mycothiol-dependent enzyme [Pseudonocardiaceae bacterium]